MQYLQWSRQLLYHYQSSLHLLSIRMGTSNTSVSTWLANLSTPPQAGNKRKRSLSEEMSVNIGDPATPAKRHRGDMAEDSTGQSPTPKPRRPGLQDPSTPISLEVSDLNIDSPARTSSVDERDSQSSASSTGYGTKRKRDGSPIKSREVGAALRNAHYGITDHTFVRANLPPRTKELGTNLLRAQLGYGIIPMDRPDLLEQVTDNISDAVVASETREKIGKSPSVEFVDDIVNQVQENIRARVSEAEWNGVQYLILHESWRLSPYREFVRFWNITTAAIEPPTLLPQLVPQSSSDIIKLELKSKKADFSLNLNLDRTMEQALYRKVTPKTLNQSMYEPLQWKPIAITIETKRPGEGWEEAVVQLKTWTAAQIAKLQKLLVQAGNPEGIASMPALPLCIVQGARWTFLSMEPSGTSAALWQGLDIGHIDDKRGVHQVVTGIQYMLEWAELTYRPWFEREIVSRLLSSTDQTITRD